MFAFVYSVMKRRNDTEPPHRGDFYLKGTKIWIVRLAKFLFTRKKNFCIGVLFLVLGLDRIPIGTLISLSINAWDRWGGMRRLVEFSSKKIVIQMLRKSGDSLYFGVFHLIVVISYNAPVFSI